MAAPNTHCEALLDGSTVRLTVHCASHYEAMALYDQINDGATKGRIVLSLIIDCSPIEG